MNNLYRIAGLLTQIDSFGRTVEQAKPYKTDGNGVPDIIVHSAWKEFQEKHPSVSIDDAEYITTGGSFYRQILEYSGIVLHSSAVVVDDTAYLFTANPGIGKSTHTGLWLKKFGERAFILNDDKPALRLEDGQWFAYGTPWSGKHDISTNARVKLGGIAVVERAEHNSIEVYRDRRLIRDIYQQTVQPGDALSRMRILELLDKLLRLTPTWKLKCNMDMQAAEIAYAAMSGKRME